MLDAALTLPLAMLAFVLGTLVGSFLNVVIARLPKGESVVTPRSHCPKCGDMIPSYLNIPIVSWLALRGKCRKCKLPISTRYPMVELLTGVLFWASFTRFGVSWGLLASFILSASMVAITFIDIDTWEIADEISLPGIAIGILFRPIAFDAPWWSGAVGAILGGGFLWGVAFTWETWMKLRIKHGKNLSEEKVAELKEKSEGMGFGDVKLIAMIGAFLGPGALLPVVMISSIVGTIIGSIVLLAKKDEPEATPSEATSSEATKPEAPPVEAAPVEAPVEAAPSEALVEAAPIGEAAPPAEAAPASENDEDEDDWVPPSSAVPFGPFLAIGCLTWLLLGPTLSRWLAQYGLGGF